MEIIVEPRGNPLSGTLNERNVEYLVRGVDNFNDAYSAAQGQIPLVFPDTALLLVSIRLQQQADQIWYATATYNPTGPAFAATVPPPEPAEVGTLVRSANFQAKNKRISKFVEAGFVRKYSATIPEGVDVTSKWKRTKWKIRTGAVGEYALFNGSGQATTFEPLAESRTMTYYVPNYLVTDTYFDTIEDLVTNGTFNAGSWRGRAEGELQIVRFSANERSADDWEFSFGFGFKKREENVVINSGLQIPTLRSCDHYWTIEEEDWDDVESQSEYYDKLVVVGRVWHLADFSVLGFPP